MEFEILDMLGLDMEEEALNRPPRIPRNPNVFNRRMDPTLALSDMEFKSHFRCFIIFILKFLSQ
jgi:hypothetical protein